MAEEHDRIEELRQSGEAIGVLASQPDLFEEAAQAFRADDAERFQDVLGRAQLLDRCRWICRWFCSKHCVFVCRKIAGPVGPSEEIDIAEWRDFAEFTARLANDEKTLLQLLQMVSAEDAKGFQQFVEAGKIQRFAHQLCHWLCMVRCQVACKRLCPPLPELIKVSYIPVGHIDAAGYGAGPSSPGSFTPSDTPASGVGDHPFGGSVHLNGIFNVVGATEYKVEVGPTAAGPWTAVTTPLTDAHWIAFTMVEYTRSATADWYSIGDMDLLSEGHTYLTDWLTPAAAVNDLHYARLVVRNSSLTEFAGHAVPVRVDNRRPIGPVPPDARPLIEFTQAGEVLGCCADVTKDNGPISIHIEGTDENFSRLEVVGYGGCSVAFTIFNKTYNGDRTDLGAPAPGITVTWDPWSSGVEPCCYVVFVRLWDRAILSDRWDGGHVYENWHSITVV